MTTNTRELTQADLAEIALAAADAKFCRKYGPDPKRWTPRQQQAWTRRAAEVRAEHGFGPDLGDAA